VQSADSAAINDESLAWFFWFVFAPSSSRFLIYGRGVIDRIFETDLRHPRGPGHLGESI
jgi:hypothetical protein